jgi:hypothetical protein
MNRPRIKVALAWIAGLLVGVGPAMMPVSVRFPSMHERLHVEMQADRAFATRIVRLACVAAVMLGVIWWLAGRSIPDQHLAHPARAAGWVLMPSILIVSLRWPGLRYALLVPSLSVTVGLLSICVHELPLGGAARVGWPLTTAGILLGDVLGMWFWFRWLPVPPSLVEPFSPGRWALIAVHAGLITSGVLLVFLVALGVIP